MGNRSLFRSASRRAPPTNARNEEMAIAYALDPKSTLAQYALTGCFRGTFYASAEDQLAKTVELCRAVNDVSFVSKLAVYAREHGGMKDMPAFLAAFVVANDKGGMLLARIFPRVIDNGKMLANFAQIVRSGVVGRKSFGSAPKRLIEAWFDARSDEAVFRASAGLGSPSLADVIRMVHPKPKSDARRALYGYLSGRNRAEHAVDASKLPALVQAFEAFKRTRDVAGVPDVPFALLTSLPLEREHWISIARTASWQTTRMNLNTFQRHGVFDDAATVDLVAERLRDPRAVRAARAFPYALLTAYRYATSVPERIRNALQDALEVATENVPKIEGKVFVCVDVSGSMRSPVTGRERGSTSVVQCVDVAALVAACMLRTNDEAEVIVFSDGVHERAGFNPRDSVLTNAQKMATEPAGGTNCSAPIAKLNREGKRGDLVIMLSDYESWMDSNGRTIRMGNAGQDGTAMMREWMAFRARNPNARLACVDLQPTPTVQAINREDIVNFGGFSDEVFTVLASAAKGELSPSHWTDRVESVDLAAA